MFESLSFQADRVDELEALHDKLQDFYKGPFCAKVYCPYPGMPCCVYANDYWHRARIKVLRSSNVMEVFLVDNGTTLETEWRFIRALDPQFLTIPEGVSLCGLVDIAPKGYKTDWGTAPTIELKRLCKSDLEAFVCGKKNQSVQIELFSVKKFTRYQLNAYLAQHKLVEWIGDCEMIVERPNNDADAKSLNASVSTPAVINEKSHKELRQKVIILDIVSPGELYVTLAKYDSGIEKMHVELQIVVASSNQGLTDWEEGENCLVNFKLSKTTKKCWYRGRIESNMGNDNYTVYLRDYGQIVHSSKNDLTDIPATFDTVSDAAYKCHLAGIRPTNQPHWSKGAIDEFRHTILSGEEFNSFALSVYGEKSNDSIPIYLWGRKKPSKDDALFGAKIVWANINQIFALKGFADCFENFKTIVDCDSLDEQLSEEAIDFTEWYKRFIDNKDGVILTDQNEDSASHQKVIVYDDDFILESELDPEHEDFAFGKVDKWLPAQPIGRYYFHANPTYVDNNAIIYLHETEQDDYIKHIRYTINKHIHEVPYDKSYAWKKGEACMVQWSDDKSFYRGVVIDVLPKNQYNVSQF